MIHSENKTSAYEDMRVYYTIDVESLLHISTNYCGNLEGFFKFKEYTVRSKRRCVLIQAWTKLNN
jgi:hypothetical protein